MKVITLWQPWASFIALGWKTIETRTHDRFKNLVGQTIGIHAGNQWDEDWFKLTRNYFSAEQRILTIKMHDNFKAGTNRGAIICTAKVVSVGWLDHRDSQQALIDCSLESDHQRFGLSLTNVKIIKPIPAKGKQGIWNFHI